MLLLHLNVPRLGQQRTFLIQDLQHYLDISGVVFPRAQSLSRILLQQLGKQLNRETFNDFCSLSLKKLKLGK